MKFFSKLPGKVLKSSSSSTESTPERQVEQTNLTLPIDGVSSTSSKSKIRSFGRCRHDVATTKFCELLASLDMSACCRVFVNKERGARRKRKMMCIEDFGENYDQGYGRGCVLFVCPLSHTQKLSKEAYSVYSIYFNYRTRMS
jgi:hypothetical protein